MPFRGHKIPGLNALLLRFYCNSTSVLPAPPLRELSKYYRLKEFRQTVPTIATDDKKIGQIHKADFFSSSLLLPSATCGMVAQRKGG